MIKYFGKIADGSLGWMMEGIHDPALIAEAKPVTDAQYLALQGVTIIPDASGNPVKAPAPVVNPNDAINAQIATIESSTMVPRISREEMMRNAERWAAVDATAINTAAIILLANAGYQRVKAVDDKIRALRAQLK